MGTDHAHTGRVEAIYLFEEFIRNFVIDSRSNWHSIV